MKNIFKSLLYSFLVFGTLVSCTEEEDDMLTGNKSTGGLLEKITPSITYAQGSDSNAPLTATFSAFQGKDAIVSVNVYKQYFGTVGSEAKVSNQALLKTVQFPLASQYETVSYSFTYNDLIQGLIYNGSPMPSNDGTLVIGDYWKLTYVAKLANGTTMNLNVKSTNVNVSCGSFLEGHYSNSTVRVSTGVVYTFADDFVKQIADGTYTTTYIGPYYCPGQTPGSSNTAPLPAGSRAGYTFTDVCKTIGLATQNLASAFTNEVRQSATQKANSKVDPVTGVITVHYSIFFTNNTVERAYITTLTPF